MLQFTSNVCGAHTELIQELKIIYSFKYFIYTCEEPSSGLSLVKIPR